jgi:hypothetical protein
MREGIAVVVSSTKLNVIRTSFKLEKVAAIYIIILIKFYVMIIPMKASLLSVIQAGASGNK